MEVKLYALSTCPWCKKTKKLLEEHGLDFIFIEVDVVDAKQKERAIETVKKHNPALTFPTLIVDNQKCVVGFKEDEIKKALGIL